MKQKLYRFWKRQNAVSIRHFLRSAVTNHTLLVILENYHLAVLIFCAQIVHSKKISIIENLKRRFSRRNFLNLVFILILSEIFCYKHLDIFLNLQETGFRVKWKLYKSIINEESYKYLKATMLKTNCVFPHFRTV